MTLSEAAEIVAGWMEPKPTRDTGDAIWWKAVYTLSGEWKWFPNDDAIESLDCLHEVEALSEGLIPFGYYNH